ncbi:MAG: hypothetical protein IAE80_25695 [Anaerolinea sp.]|nr:hypothetical protein [Anaerolinea sp.]
MKRLIILVSICALSVRLTTVVAQPTLQDNLPLVSVVPISVQPVDLPSTVRWAGDSDQLELIEANREQAEPQLQLETWTLSEDAVSSLGVSHGFQPTPDVGSILAWSPDGTRLAALSFENIVVYETATGAPLFSRQGAPEYFLSWRPDSSQFAVISLSDFFSFDLIDAVDGRTERTYRLFADAFTRAGSILYNVTWGSETELAAIGAGDHRAVLNLETNTESNIDDCCTEGAYELEWQPGGRLLATHNQVYDLDSRQVVFTYPWHRQVYWSLDGHWLLGAVGTELTLISVSEQRVVAHFSTAALGEDHIVREVAWSPNADHAAIFTATPGINTPSESLLSIWDIGELISQAGQ